MLGSYASFLWDAEEDDDDEAAPAATTPAAVAAPAAPGDFPALVPPRYC